MIADWYALDRQRSDAGRPEAHDGDPVHRFRRHQREIVLRRRLGRTHRAPLLRGEGRGRHACLRGAPGGDGENADAGPGESSGHRRMDVTM